MKKYFLRTFTYKPYYIRTQLYICVPAVIGVFVSILLLKAITSVAIGLFLFSVSMSALSFILPYKYYFCYDESNSNIIFKSFGKIKLQIPISSVSKLIESKNDDGSKGATSTRYDRTIYAVTDKDGYEYFYVIADNDVFAFSKNHNIPIIKYVDGIPMDISDRY